MGRGCLGRGYLGVGLPITRIATKRFYKGLVGTVLLQVKGLNALTNMNPKP